MNSQQWQFETIINHSVYASILLDRNREIVLINQAAVDLLALCSRHTPKVGSSIEEILQEQTLKEALLLASEGTKTDIIIRSKKNGIVNWIQLFFVPIMDDANGVQHILINGSDITKSKTNELSLYKTKANLKAIFESSPIAYFLIGIDNRILTLNPKGKQFVFDHLGVVIDIGDNLLNIIPEKYKKLFLETADKALFDNKTRMEVNYFDLSGKENWYEIRFRSALNGDGNVYAYIFTINNISRLKQLNNEVEEQKNTQQQQNKILQKYTKDLEFLNLEAYERNEELQILVETNNEKQSKLAAIIENAPVALCAIDSHYRVENFNSKFEELLSHSYDQPVTVGCSLGDILTNENDKIIVDSIEAAFRGEYSVYEHRCLNAKNKNYCLIHHAPIVHNNSIKSTLLLITDITSLKLIEHELEYEKSMLDMFMNYSIDKLYFKDINHRFIRVNKSWLEAFSNNQSSIDVIGKNDFDYFAENFAEKTAQDETQIITTNTPLVNCQEEHIDDNGNIMWYESTKIPWYNDEKQIIGTFGISRDITSRKEAEIKIKEQAQKLKDLNATKDKFFSIIAHDLKNPFSTIIQLSDLLINTFEKKDREKILHFIKLINDTSVVAFSLLENLLNWSRAQTGRLKVVATPFSIADVIKDVCMLNTINAEHKKINLIQDVMNCSVYADIHLTTTVVRNLVSNAIKFTNQGGTITISTRKYNDKELMVSVQDNGIGIDDACMKRMFKLGEQHTTVGTNNEAGTGLGLILCKEFIETNGGNIFIESEAGKGSTFSFTLPMSDS